ncbi:TPA: hypothetical protein DEB00_03140 [Candidatus Uhrbacteria bacterium]|nr:hypothetical protein [Candidatus Uhrbacteria bacterium]
MSTTQPVSSAPVGKLPKIGEILTVSIEAAKKHFRVYAKVILPYFGIMLLQMLLGYLPDNAIKFVLWILISLVSFAYAIWMGIILTRLSYQAVTTGMVSMEKAKQDLQAVIWPMFAVGLISAVATFFGLFLFIVPGIVLALMFFSAKFLAIIDQKNIGDSLRISIQMVKGRKWDLFVKLFVSLFLVGVIYYLAVIIVGIIFGVIGSSVSTDVGGILLVIGILAISLPFTTVLVNIPTMIFSHLKKLNGMN